MRTRWGSSSVFAANPFHFQDGFITAKDLKAFFTTFQKKLSDEDIKKIINDGDENGDDKIDINEFVNIMTKN